jgi:Domain of unknown function (DUF1877)
MGLRLTLVTIADVNIARVHDDPPLIWQVIAQDEPDLYAQARAPQKPSLITRLFGGGAPPAAAPQPPPLTLTAPEGESTDLDKAWHGLHYLLTGSAWEGDPPLNFLLAGGTAVDTEVADDQPRTFTSSETRVVQQALAGITDEALLTRYVPADLTKLEIYPDVIWERDEGTENDPRQYLLEYWKELRAFVDRAAKNGVGLIVYIS